LRWSLTSHNRRTQRVISLRDITTRPPSRQVPDKYVPAVFNGVSPDAEERLVHFQRYIACRQNQMDERDQLAFFPLFLRDSAVDWYDTLSERVKNDVKALLAAFLRSSVRRLVAVERGFYNL